MALNIVSLLCCVHFRILKEKKFHSAKKPKVFPCTPPLLIIYSKMLLLYYYYCYSIFTDFFIISWLSNDSKGLKNNPDLDKYNQEVRCSDLVSGLTQFR